MKNTFAFAVVLAFSVFSRAQVERVAISNSDSWIAIVGDSAASGAVTNPKLKPKISNLLPKVISFFTIGYDVVPKLKYIPQAERFNVTDPIDRATRITHSAVEYAEAMKSNETRALLRSGRASRVVDTPEYTFGYFVGRKMGVKGSDVVLVGQDGVRVDSIAKQFERLNVLQEPTLPPLIFVSFTANDLCDNGIFEESVEARAAKFEQEIRKQFSIVFKKHQPHRRTSRIVVLAPLDVVNVLTNPSLLEQVTDFQGLGKVKCKTLREGSLPKWNLSEAMRGALVGMCSSVLGSSAKDHSRIQKIRNVQTAFGEVWKKLIAEWQAGAAPRGFHFQYVESIRGLNFQAGDLGNDCFHPGIRAHQKIADEVLGFLKHN